MLDLHVEKIGELAVVECKGSVVRSEAAFHLREAVVALRNARIIVLDLSEVRAIDAPVSATMGFRPQHSIQVVQSYWIRA